jgi:hypothetical protein
MYVGVSLEIEDSSGLAAHEIQYWEITRFLPPVSNANEIYDSPKAQLLSHSTTNELPCGMPVLRNDTTATVNQTGDGAYILFSSPENMSEGMKGMSNVVKRDYREGYALIEMPDRYTMRMLAHDLMGLTPPWRILPVSVTRRDP